MWWFAAPCLCFHPVLEDCRSKWTSTNYLNLEMERQHLLALFPCLSAPWKYFTVNFNTSNSHNKLSAKVHICNSYSNLALATRLVTASIETWQTFLLALPSHPLTSDLVTYLLYTVTHYSVARIRCYSWNLWALMSDLCADPLSWETKNLYFNLQ